MEKYEGIVKEERYVVEIGRYKKEIIKEIGIKEKIYKVKGY